MHASDNVVVEPVLTTLEEGVLWVRLNRPHVRNAIDRALARGVLRALNHADDDPAVRVVVITGQGDAFCDGDDISTFADANTTPLDPDDGVVLYTRIVSRMVRLRKPVVAGINGLVAGAGLDLVCAADLRYAASNARIGSLLMKVGHPGNIAMLSRVVGMSRATEIVFTGRLIDAEEALRIGLVHQVFEASTFVTELLDAARFVARQPTKAIAFVKELREATVAQSVECAMALMNRIHHRADREIGDSRKGLHAFLEGRKPNFTGQ